MNFVRRSLFTLFVLSLVAVFGCSGPRVDWRHDYRSGMEEAAGLRRRAVLMFVSPWDVNCRAVDQDVFADEDVCNLMREFVAIRLDAHLNQALMQSCRVDALPGFVIIRPDGQIVATKTGALDASQFRMFLLTNLYH